MKDSSEAPEFLRVFRLESKVQVLGPGARAVIWVQGCPFACEGCIVPESWDAQQGWVHSIAELVQWVLSQEGIEGVTFSGGEPMAQAAALHRLVRMMRLEADLGVMCYTGYTLQHLIRYGSAAQQALLKSADLLIDGTYIERLHADLLWRGSSNQRLLPLTERYRSIVEELGTANGGEDRSVGIEIFIDENGLPAFAGVPPLPRFRETFEQQLRNHGVNLKP